MKRINVLMMVLALFTFTLASCGCQECVGGTYDGDENCSRSRIVKQSFKSSCQSGGGTVK
ncbi:MAG: hypothetical protein WD048_17035 [Chitinophagales bacterium]